MEPIKRDIVVIVEALSTGINLVLDCIEQGVEPMVLETWLEDEGTRRVFDEYRGKTYRKTGVDFRVLQEDPDYQVTLKMIRELDPKVVLAGAEGGVILATRLAEDLGLTGNPYARVASMTNKFHMHRALEEAGVRCIRGRMVASTEEALAYYDELGNDSIVIKPPHGASAMGVRLCYSREELVDYFQQELHSISFLGDRNDQYLVQEMICGDEYVVNTLSIQGKHYVSSIWKYDREEIADGHKIMIGYHAIDRITPRIFELIQYAFKALDAVGVVNGPVHGEYMYDEQGPVLMEVNCRAMGNSYPIDFGNRVFGHHETDLILKSYLDPEAAIEQLSQPYGVKEYGVIKEVITPKEMNIVNSPIIQLLPLLRSFHSSSIATSVFKERLERTVDLETSVGTVHQLHPDHAIVEQEYALLHEIEIKYFELIYQESYDPDLGALPEVEGADDSMDEIVLQVSRLKDYPREDVYNYLTRFLKQLKRGGIVRVPKDIYDEFPYGLDGMIIILSLMGVEIQAPRQDSADIIGIRG